MKTQRMYGMPKQMIPEYSKAIPVPKRNGQRPSEIYTAETTI